MAVHSIKEISNLLELHSMNNSELDQIINLFNGGAATKMLYLRMMHISLDTSLKSQKWILKPENGISRTESIKKWIEKTGAGCMNSKDLLLYFKASTYRASLKILVNNDLVHIDKFNRMWLNYPVNGKNLNLVYAAKAIKSSYKKSNEDKREEHENSDVSDVSDVADDKRNFWE